MIPNFRQTHNCDICYAANFILLSLPCCNFTKVLCVSCILKCFVDLDDFLYKKCPFCTTTDVSVRITSCLNIVSRDIIPVLRILKSAIFFMCQYYFWMAAIQTALNNVQSDEYQRPYLWNQLY